MEKNTGKVVQIIGAVLDVRFESGQLPKILNAVIVEQGERRIVSEAFQHIGDNTVRCVAMASTDGLVRGAVAVDTGAPITVPVGKATLGRLFNVLGEVVDNKEDVSREEMLPIHREAPKFDEQET